MTNLKLINVALSRKADWKLKLTRSGGWITRNQAAPPDESVRIYLRRPRELPEASAETLQILEDLGIE